MIAATTAKVKKFVEEIENFYNEKGRALPWRKTRDPYKILVSEFMLQQTQVGRVEGKYREFIAKYPDIRSLASAPLSEVLSIWSGLGYNRRARALSDTARVIMQRHDGRVPQNRDDLLRLPGIGQSTAGAIRAFAFDEREAFIETNIRRVFIYHFAKRRAQVHDEELLPLIEKTIKMARSPRIWYWALMDYGSQLPKATANPNHKSVHYRKQGKFLGSDRQVRGAIMRILLKKGRVAKAQIINAVNDFPQHQINKGLETLLREGLLVRIDNTYTLPK